MRVLFVMLRPGYVRNYESTLRLLADRGHTIHVAFVRGPKHENSPDTKPIESLAAAYQQITFDEAARRDPADGWTVIATAIRLLGDFGRYLHPRFRDAPLLRARAEGKLLHTVRSRSPRILRPALVSLTRWLGRRSSATLANVICGFCRRAEQAIPPSKHVVNYMLAHSSDVVLATPVVDIGSQEAEYFKAARALALPSAVCVASWDNLTNKGVLRVDPEAVFVWNEIQKREAVEMHGVSSERVVVTGAQRFDQWFEQKPTRTAAELRRASGLDPAIPYLLYLGSSAFVAPKEASFVAHWLSAIRAADAAELRRIGILVRPHPENADGYEHLDVETYGNVAIWPRMGAQVIDEASRADFYDSLAHCLAVVGVNTSALIEASILGKEVHTLVSPEFEEAQIGTLHYHHLRIENGGFLHETHRFDEHLDQLTAACRGVLDGAERRQRFVESFVRPLGLDVPATPVLADGIENLATQPIRDVRTPLSTRLLALLFGVATAVLRRPVRRGLARVRHGALSMRRRTTEYVARSDRARNAVRKTLDVLEIDDISVTPASGQPAPYRLVGRRVEDELRSLLERDRDRIVLGPWDRELSTEVLYWIPFLRWVVERYAPDPQRLLAVSRGDVPSWYRGIAGSYVDRSDYSPPGSADGSSAALDPALLLKLFGEYWRGTYPVGHVLRYTSIARLESPDDASLERLPESYVATAFGFSDCFPNTRENRDLARSLIGRIAQTTPVVILDEPQTTDLDVASDLDDPRVLRVLEGVPASGLPAAQSAIAHGAQAVVGSLGTEAVSLGPPHGIATVAVYTDPSSVSSPHVDMLQRTARALDSTFAAVNASQLDLVSRVACGGLRTLSASGQLRREALASSSGHRDLLRPRRPWR